MNAETSRSSRLVAWLTGVATLALAAIAMAPLVRYCVVHPNGRNFSCRFSLSRMSDTDDWRYFTAVWEAARVAITTYHQLPSWNPYHCGGIILYQDPQGPFPSPLFLLLFAWLPTTIALKTWVFAHFIAGATGARALAHDRGANAVEQLVAAAICTLCGFCAWHFGGGHLSFTPFLLYPWLLWSQRRSANDPRWAVLTAALLALCVYEGATYPLPLMIVGLVIDAIARLANRRESRNTLLAGAIVVLLVPLLSAPRLVPLLHFLKRNPRLVPLDDKMSFLEVLQTWTTRWHGWHFPGHNYVWAEYGAFVGYAVVVTAALGVVVALRARDTRTRSRRIDLALLVVAVWCALGATDHLSLFRVLHMLPVYSSLRVPSRFLYPATVALALMAVHALVYLRERVMAWRPTARTATMVVAAELLFLVGISIDMGIAALPTMQFDFAEAPPFRRATPGLEVVPGYDYDRWSLYPTRGVSTPMCYVPIQWQVSNALWLGAEAQHRLEPSDAGTVRAAPWTPNAYSFDVSLRAHATIVVNTNHDAGWSTNVGWIETRSDILMVRLPPGHHRVTLRHRPQGLGLGLLLGVWGLAIAAYITRRRSAGDRDARLMAPR